MRCARTPCCRPRGPAPCWRCSARTRRPPGTRARRRRHRACRAAGLRRGRTAASRRCCRCRCVPKSPAKYCVPIGFTDASPIAWIDDGAGRGEIRIEERRRHLQHVGDVVEAFRDVVLRQHRVHVCFDVQQVPHRVRVFLAVEAMERDAARLRMFLRGLVELAFHVRDEAGGAPPSAAACCPPGGMSWPRSLRTACSHVSASSADVVRSTSCRTRHRRPSPWRCGTCRSSSQEARVIVGRGRRTSGIGRWRSSDCDGATCCRTAWRRVRCRCGGCCGSRQRGRALLRIR